MANNTNIWWLSLDGHRKAAAADLNRLYRIAAYMMGGTIKSITVKQAMDFGFRISKPDDVPEPKLQE